MFFEHKYFFLKLNFFVSSPQFCSFCTHFCKKELKDFNKFARIDLQMSNTRKLLSGNEAIALAAYHAGCALGVGYPGTPSTEILEKFSELGGKAQWAPNEKVAAEVALGVAFANSNAICTMKHVGFNVAQDLFFTAAYSGVQGGYVIVVADDPGMASSQNEQDTRSLAYVGGLPVLEPSDSQEAYDFTKLAFKISRQWGTPVVLRTTTRISHSNTIVAYDDVCEPLPEAKYERQIPMRVMVPGHAKPAHKRLRKRLADLQAWNSKEGPNKVIEGKSDELGIVSSGVAFEHAYEAAPDAGFFKVGMSNPLPIDAIVEFAKKYKRIVAVEEGDPYLTTLIRAAGVMNLEPRAETWRFGEFSVDRAAAQIRGDKTEEVRAIKAKPPQLCKGCPHQFSFAPLSEEKLIIAGDIGCYTLAALKPLEAMDIQICMGASMGIGLGLRHVLPEKEARRVVSVMGDSTFMHSGLTGLVEMVYNAPKTGHVVIVVDNSITAMTGQQENPATGRKLDHSKANRVIIEDVARGIGVKNVASFNPIKQKEEFKAYLRECLAKDELSLIVLKQPCVLAAGMIAKWNAQNEGNH